MNFQYHKKPLFILLLYLMSVANCELYHISPTKDICDDPSCLTISELALYHALDSDTSLKFLSGHHILHFELIITNVWNLNLTSHSNVSLTCLSPAKIQFINIHHLHINRIVFVGCSGTIIQSVSEFTIQDSSFLGQSTGMGSALNVNRSFGIMARTQFLSNKNGTYKWSVAISHEKDRVGGAVFITKSNILILNSTFGRNSAEVGGVIYGEQLSNITIDRSVFFENSVMCTDSWKECFGGVLGVEGGTNLIIQNSSFYGNKAIGKYGNGGVLTAIESTVTIKNSSFTNNNAANSGGVFIAQQSNFVIDATNFTNNRGDYGGVFFLSASNATIHGATFVSGRAQSRGGVVFAQTSILNISGIICAQNYAHEEAGVFYLIRTWLTIHGSKFYSNSAGYGGVMSIQGPSAQLDIERSKFANNTAYQNGGIICLEKSVLTITHSDFVNSIAFRHGGVLYTSNASVAIQDSHFLHGKAYQYGSVLYVITTDLKCNGTVIFSNNVARLGTMYLLQSLVLLMGNFSFTNNLGSIFARKTIVNLTGYTTVINSSSVRLNLAPRFSEGGGITAYQSKVNIHGRCILMYNQAHNGGGVYASESEVYVYSKTAVISNNKASNNGGGMFLHLSELDCQINCVLKISNNSASQKGGGIHAISSVINVHFSYNEDNIGASVFFVGNQADLGGGACLDANSKLYILKKDWSTHLHFSITFTTNSANYGGALFISDETNSGICASASYQLLPVITQCFMQSVAQYSFIAAININLVNMEFVKNLAHISGQTLYGGLLDRCTVSPSAEVYKLWDDLYHPYGKPDIITGVDYFTNITNIRNLDSISSHPTRICFCTNGEPKCNYNPLPLQVKKGERFTVHLVAVDQVNHTVPKANIKTTLKSPQSGLGEGQLIQTTLSNKACTKLQFNVFSPHEYEELILHPEGPCKDAVLSKHTLQIQFLPCQCPVGLQPKLNETLNCVCECDSRIRPYVSGCNSTTGGVVKEGPSWISFINVTNDLSATTGVFVIHPYCPFDYCTPFYSETEINFNLINGADAQCSHNRSGILCGSCKHGLSLSLGSSRCIICSRSWPANLAATLIGAAIAGILLIVVLLVLNLTVATGTLNGIILYVNIISAYGSTFFPNSETNFVTVFIAWLNLEIGLDFCFIEGMDAYYKTWLQVAFPAFVILLVVLVISFSEYCSKFAQVIGRKNPIAVLATLILLSYTKLLHTTIAALSFTFLQYPGGARELLWLPDTSILYLRGKHIPLFITALIILLCGVGYTTLLFTWQWLLYHQDKRILRWICRSQKFTLFIEPYHAPFTFKHRYWIGLLLLVRVVLSVISAVNTSSDPGINLLSVGTALTLLLIVRSCLQGNRIYRKKPVEILELMCFLNIIILCLASFFVLESSFNRNILGYISGSITFILCIIVVTAHIILEFCIKARYLKKLVGLRRSTRRVQHGSVNDSCEALMEISGGSEDVECSISVVDAPPRHEQPLSSLLEEQLLSTGCIHHKNASTSVASDDI